MSLSNCKKCGALFSKTSRSICPECIRREEERFEQVYNWIRDNPKSTIASVSEGTGVETREILKWIREKRIVLADCSRPVECKKCGEPIHDGMFCTSCRDALSQDMKQGIETAKKGKEPASRAKKPGMYYKST